MITITSINNQIVKDILSLQQKKNRQIKKQFIIEGQHLVEEAYRNNLLDMVLSTSIDTLSLFSNVNQILVNEAIIKKISTTVNPQSIVGICNIIDKKIDCFKNLVVLDNINDPGNLGTIIRTCVALGYKNIVLSKSSVDIYNEKVIRATQGAIFKINFEYVDLESLYLKLNSLNIPILATSLNTTNTLSDVLDYKEYAIVFGNEANGISDVSIKYSNLLVKIPITSDIESLNVAISAGIILYSLKKSVTKK